MIMPSDHIVRLILFALLVCALIVALVIDNKEQFRDLIEAFLPSGDKLREALYGKEPEISELAFFKAPLAAPTNIVGVHKKTKEKENMNVMPELKFGDVVKWDDGSYGIVTKTRIYLLGEMDGLVTAMGIHHTRTEKPIVRIYRRGDFGFDQEDLRWIYDGCLPSERMHYILWERPEVREMTVDEISKELGYTVKVIGEK